MPTWRNVLLLRKKKMKNKTTKFTLVILLATTLFTSCNIQFPFQKNSNNEGNGFFFSYNYSDDYWLDVFNQFYDDMSVNYMFWDIEDAKNDPYQIETNQVSVDWDDIYYEYEPKFDALSELYVGKTKAIGESDDDFIIRMFQERAEKANTYFGDITENLVDNHFGLIMYDRNAALSQMYYIHQRPGTLKMSNRNDYRYDYFWFNMQKYIYDNMISNSSSTDPTAVGYTVSDQKYFWASPNDGNIYTYENSPFMILSSKLNDDTAYLYLSGFQISSYISENSPGLGQSTVSDILQNFYDLAKDNSVSRIIIDLRHNNGGYVADFNYLVAPFVEEDEFQVFGYIKNKNGVNRYEYAEPAEARVKGTGELYNLNKPVIMVTDSTSISMSEITTTSMKSIENLDVYQVGQRTFGGTCTLLDNNLLAGGISCFNYKITTACSRFYTTDMKSIESIGLIPDDGYDMGPNPLTIEYTTEGGKTIFYTEEDDLMLLKAFEISN
jgi:hypothetical protein